MTKYSVILCDAPWSYGNRGLEYSALQQYATMKVSELKAMPVRSKAAEDCVLLFWATWPQLKNAMEIIDEWGFDFVTGMPWVKCTKSEEDLWGDWHMKAQYGVGFWVRGCSEPILIARRGKPALPPGDFIGLISPNIMHSRKPDNIYEFAESMPGPYLEMFARRPRAGWDQFGNEVENSIAL